MSSHIFSDFRHVYPKPVNKFNRGLWFSNQNIVSMICTSCLLCNQSSILSCLTVSGVFLLCMQKTTPNVINWQDYEGCTALHLAVADGNEAVVAALVNVPFLLVFKFSIA
jgi:hypothetical protein